MLKLIEKLSSTRPCRATADLERGHAVYYAGLKDSTSTERKRKESQINERLAPPHTRVSVSLSLCTRLAVGPICFIPSFHHAPGGSCGTPRGRACQMMLATPCDSISLKQRGSTM